MGMPASSKAGGMCLGFPDVCKTPILGVPVPIPYPNMAQVSNAKKTVSKVVIENKETCVKPSKMKSSSGDEAGVQNGVISNKIMKKVVYKKASSKVQFKGKKAVYHTAMTAHNKGNFPAGLQISPSQSKVSVAT